MELKEYMAKIDTRDGKVTNPDARIYIRMITPEDTDLVVAWRNTDFVRDHFIYRGPFTREIHENWLRTKVATGQVVQFIICLKEGDKPIGSVYFSGVDRTHNHAEYGIFIGEEDATGKGYGTETARLALSYAFTEMKLHKVVLRLLSDNERALHSYENAGFVREGLFKEYVLLDGKYRDVVFMGCINPLDVV